MSALKFVRSVWESFQSTSGVEPRLINTLRITAVEPGKVNFELPIEQHHTNRLGILHGATLATMVDTSGSLALASRGLYSTGVSTDISVTYLGAGGKVGDVVKGEVICDKFGKTLAFTSVKFMNSKNEIVARGSHTKFVASAFKDERNITDELKPEVEMYMQQEPFEARSCIWTCYVRDLCGRLRDWHFDETHQSTYSCGFPACHEGSATALNMAPRASKSSARGIPGLPPTTFVLDNGGYTIKAGFAPAPFVSDQDALFKCRVIPNAIVRSRDRKVYVGSHSEEITQWSEALFRRPVENGQVVSWETQKEIWDQSFFDESTATTELLITSPEDTTLIFTEPPNTMPALQKNADEIIMEEWGFGGYSRIIGPSLNAYNDLHPLFEETSSPASDSMKMECLLVIDSGYSHTTITPTFNGRPMHRAIRRLDFGGKHLTNLLKEVISVRHFDLHQDTKIVNDIKEEVSFVSSDLRRGLEKTWKGNKSHQTPVPTKVLEGDGAVKAEQQALSDEFRLDYILPDGMHILKGFSRPHDPSPAARKRKQAALASGTADAEISMTLGNERFTVPEILFSPSDIGSKQPGLADIVMQSLAVLPPLVQATMLCNVLVVGGTAKIPGFVERIEAELRTRVKAEWIVRVRKMEDSITSTWLGGARMASRSPEIVREYGITREEYLEHGSAWAARRFRSLS
ncbi:actin-domain-containing protein [Exophiala viscosa]|uniref:actin-domain-containing protein n=1 Tax=Exophiala viscosa TaxID=2486360 RepID=UPI00219E4DEC|nr:actin-domain-containing protein [Exophiala viscosa]